MNEVDAHIGHVLLSRRKALTLTSVEAAAACKLDVPTLVGLERGTIRASAVQLYTILKFYGLTPADLLQVQVLGIPDCVH